MSPTDTVTLSLAEVEDLATRALAASGVSPANAASVAASVVDSEAEGVHSHGLARLPTYCEHARCGKIDGRAEPGLLDRGPAFVRVDARDGFAHPAIDLGLADLIPLAHEAGVAALAVTNSYNCGVCGYHVGRIARAGLVGLGFVNAPASIAPWGGVKPVFGTNPISLGVPTGKGEVPIVIDQSSSVVAKSEIVVHAQKGEPIPEGWALDAAGNPTTDPKAALAGGTMVPSGGYKGAGIAFLVEVLAAAVTGATLSAKASSFADNEGGSPRTGQLFLALDPEKLSGGAFAGNMAALCEAILGQEGTRLPGTRRAAARDRTASEGVTFRKALHEKLLGYCEA